MADGPPTVILRADLLLVSMSGRGRSIPIKEIKKWGTTVPGLWEFDTENSPLTSNETNRAITVALQYLEFHAHVIIDWDRGHVHGNPSAWLRDWLDPRDEPTWHLVGVRPGRLPDGFNREQIYVDDDRQLRNIRSCKLVLRLPDLIQATANLPEPEQFEATAPTDSVPAAWRLLNSLRERGADELFDELKETVDEVNEVRAEFTSGEFFNIQDGRYSDFKKLCESQNRSLEDFEGRWLMRHKYEERTRSYVDDLRRIMNIGDTMVQFERIKIEKSERNWSQYHIMSDAIETFVFEPDSNHVSHLYTLQLPMAVRRALTSASGLEPKRINRNGRWWIRYQNIHPLLAISIARMLSVALSDMFPEEADDS